MRCISCSLSYCYIMDCLYTGLLCTAHNIEDNPWNILSLYTMADLHYDGLHARGKAMVWNSKYPVATTTSTICYSISNLMTHIALKIFEASRYVMNSYLDRYMGSGNRFRNWRCYTIDDSISNDLFRLMNGKNVVFEFSTACLLGTSPTRKLLIPSSGSKILWHDSKSE